MCLLALLLPSGYLGGMPTSASRANAVSASPDASLDGSGIGVYSGRSAAAVNCMTQLISSHDCLMVRFVLLLLGLR